MTKRRAKAEIDAREYYDWIAWHEIEPLGTARAASWQMASIGAALYNVQLAKSSDRVEPAEFMPKPPPEARPEMTEAQEAAMFISAFESHATAWGQRAA